MTKYEVILVQRLGSNIPFDYGTKQHILNTVGYTLSDMPMGEDIVLKFTKTE